MGKAVIIANAVSMGFLWYRHFSEAPYCDNYASDKQATAVNEIIVVITTTAVFEATSATKAIAGTKATKIPNNMQ